MSSNIQKKEFTKSQNKEVIINTKNIGKEFNGVWVLNDINFDLKKGEIHSIVGENGAGKSTFIKILSGVHRPSSGELQFKNKKVNFENVKDSKNIGLRTVHQEINLVPFFNVVENIFTGTEFEKKFMGLNVLDKRKMRKKAKEVLDMLGASIDINKYVHQLDASSQRIVQISKVLVHEPDVVIFDEPTTALGEDKRDKLLKIISDLKEKDIGIIFVSHDLDEIMQISDRITVFRDGYKIDTLDKEEASSDEIIQKMIGNKSFGNFKRVCKVNLAEKGPKFQVENLKTDKLKNINFKVKECEILGIAGVMGAGKTEIAKAIFGLDEVQQGKFKINGEKYTPNPYKSVKKGLALVPEERQEEGLIPNMMVKENITLAYLDKWAKNGIINFKSELNITKELIDKLKIKTEGPKQGVKFLSGGNQQKVVLGRWLSSDFSVGIFDEVTKGIDVKAKEDIYNEINDMANNGKGIIFLSSYLPELMSISDRIIAIRNGKIIDEFIPNEAKQEDIMKAMLGGDDS